MTDSDYLPLAFLNAWEYCPRRFYWEYVLGQLQDNEHIILGRHLHRNVNEPGIERNGETIIYRQQWVWSDRLQVSGIIDLVEERDGQLIPVEFKKGRMSRHLNDYFQLCAAGLCLEERTGNNIQCGEIFYYGNRRRQLVEFTPQLRQNTEAAIAAARRAVNNPMPPPIEHRQKCRDCSLKAICLPSEVRQLARCIFEEDN